MTVTNQIKILDKQIMQNEAQYDLHRKAAKISALSSKNLEKYEYLTGEDLGLKPSTIEQAKFEYSPLGRTVNKGLDKDDQKDLICYYLESLKYYFSYFYICLMPFLTHQRLVLSHHCKVRVLHFH